MERAEVNETELSRRIDVARLTVRRWRQTENLPSEQMIRRLRSGLRWIDSAGKVRDLTEDEIRQLIVAAGYVVDGPLEHEADKDKVIRNNRCAVYTHKYGPENFPSQWSTRIIELERLTDGNIYTMWSSLPSITRPREYYEGAWQLPNFKATGDLYDKNRVKPYMDAHEERQERFESRLKYHQVLHLYSIEGVERYLRLEKRENSVENDERHPLLSLPEIWQPPNAVLLKQVKKVLYWLVNYPNFEVKLRPGHVAGNVTVMREGGHDYVVLVEFARAWQRMTMEGIHGLEIAGTEAADQFRQQFNSFWADFHTIKSRDEVIRRLEGWLRALGGEPSLNDEGVMLG
jgi:hypothetical protein